MHGIDAITLLKKDHKEVKALFREFSKAKLNAQRAQPIAEKIMRELHLHATIEEKLFYPAIKSAVEETSDLVAEAFQEHHMVKICITELQGMNARQELFHAKMQVLIENVEHHIEEEEQALFPKVRKAMGRAKLQQIGAAMEQMKKSLAAEPKPEPLDLRGGKLNPQLESGPPSEIRELLQARDDRA